MNNTFALILAGLAGGLTGLFFFGGLWWTVRRALVSPRPALWVVSSLLLRSGVTVAVFLLVGVGDWQRLLLCLLGFWVARQGVVRLTAPATALPTAASPVINVESCHAPGP